MYDHMNNSIYYFLYATCFLLYDQVPSCRLCTRKI